MDNMAKAPATTPKSDKPSSIVLADDLSAIPDFMRPDVGKGTENIGMEDMDTPRIKLMQGLSPELESHSDLRIGHFFHTANDLSLGASFRAVAVYTDQRYILWRPRDMGGGILAREMLGRKARPAIELGHRRPPDLRAMRIGDREQRVPDGTGLGRDVAGEPAEFAPRVGSATGTDERDSHLGLLGAGEFRAQSSRAAATIFASVGSTSFAAGPSGM